MMEQNNQQEQSTESVQESNNSWRDGAVGHQLVDLLEQSRELPEQE
ncbi:hypothetical protein [Ferrimonas lipolytica]|uniref:Uncharacterized protein n=1 Tax=Ferrimonas lipolytica TaxID=2724191 RepID=A0A6H1UCH5_9GAMM|nr:hypothetical protein [Ferrimonas lipolytica]QIZ75512.1 hypothetical protein HER31_00480 [Ferrimonas lipolytica]